MKFEVLFNKPEFVLTEGAIAERLKNEFKVEFDQYVNHASLIYEVPEILTVLYKQYINIAQKYNIPIMLMTPTRKVNFETTRYSKFSDRNMISDSCVYLNDLRREYSDFHDKIFIGGLLGCKGDAYRSDNALGIEESYEFHKIQVNIFKKEKIDFLFAGIMPALSESVGMARAMADSGIPYIISFMIRKEGFLLDGTSISDAIALIDSIVNPQPVGYMANCIHPLTLKTALANEINLNSQLPKRFLGIQANASTLSPEELNNCGILHQENFDEMINEIFFLIKKYDFKILGGCCGTNDIFIEKLAKRLHENLAQNACN